MWYLISFIWHLYHFRLKNAFRQNTGHYECSAEVNEVEASVLRPKRRSGRNLNNLSMGIFIDVLCKYIFLISISLYFTGSSKKIRILQLFLNILYIWEYSCCHNSILKCNLWYDFWLFHVFCFFSLLFITLIWRK